jgi:hypothetical protein
MWYIFWGSLIISRPGMSRKGDRDSGNRYLIRKKLSLHRNLPTTLNAFAPT